MVRMNFRKECMYFLILMLWTTICHAKKDKVDLGGDPSYHRHRTKRAAPLGQAIDPETQLQQSLLSIQPQAAQPPEAPAGTAVTNPQLPSASTSVTSFEATTSSSSSNMVEEQEGIGDSRTRLDSTGEVGIGEFKDGHEKVKTYQVTLDTLIVLIQFQLHSSACIFTYRILFFSFCRCPSWIR